VNSRESERPQLVAIDVDGTLAKSDGSLSEKTCETIAKVRSTGTKIVIATGRPWLVAFDCVEKLGEVDFVVCSNGAMTVALPSEEILEDIYLPSELPEKLVRSLRSKIPGIAFAYEFKRGVKATVIAPLEHTTKSTSPNFSTQSNATNQGLPVAITIFVSAALTFAIALQVFSESEPSDLASVPSTSIATS
jgi:HAD superfamily hydrolase (TIGR01484 family)